MRTEAPPDHALLDAWREQGADRVDPFAYHYMAALRRRVAEQDEGTRQRLEQHLSERILAYAARLERDPPAAAASPAAANATRGALGELAERLAQRSALAHGAATHADAPAAAATELNVLDEFRKIWSDVRSDSQLRRSLQPSSQDAGPLNSSRLVHRALSLMREVSPGYLQQLLAYVDALSWLEQMQAGGILETGDTPTREVGKPRTRAKPRKRRE